MISEGIRAFTYECGIDMRMYWFRYFPQIIALRHICELVVASSSIHICVMSQRGYYRFRLSPRSMYRLSTSCVYYLMKLIASALSSMTLHILYAAEGATLAYSNGNWNHPLSERYPGLLAPVVK